MVRTARFELACVQLPFQVFRRDRGYVRMNCLHCNKITKNPKYCSRSCSASVNNKQHPRRKATEKFCYKCGVSKGHIPWKETSKGDVRNMCDNCHKEKSDRGDVYLQTKASLRGSGNANRGGRYPMIRQWSRKSYIDSGQPMACKICGYDYHVDIAHIRDVKDFPEETTIAEINDLSNLVALCKNHHYEFDSHLFQL